MDQVRTAQQTAGQGELLLTVGVNLDEILNTFEAILTKETRFDELDETQIICGQNKEEYARTMRFTKL